MNNKEHWNKIYKNKSPLEVSWYQHRPSISLAIIDNLPVQKDEYIIDIGGGASALVDNLLQDGFNNVTVLDLSSRALNHAKERLGEKSRLVSWVAEDVTNFSPTIKYSIWHDRAVFHFLISSDARQKYHNCLNSSVKIGGYVIIAAFSIGGPTMCSGLDFVQYDSEKIRNELGSNYELVDEMSEIHITPDGKEQLFGYFVFNKIA